MFTCVIFVARSPLAALVLPASAVFALIVSKEASIAIAVQMNASATLRRAQVSESHYWLNLLLHLNHIQAIFIQLGWIKVFQVNRP